jgi:hypothetical protein
MIQLLLLITMIALPIIFVRFFFLYLCNFCLVLVIYLFDFI